MAYNKYPFQSGPLRQLKIPVHKRTIAAKSRLKARWRAGTERKKSKQGCFGFTAGTTNAKVSPQEVFYFDDMPRVAERTATLGSLMLDVEHRTYWKTGMQSTSAIVPFSTNISLLFPPIYTDALVGFWQLGFLTSFKGVVCCYAKKAAKAFLRS